MKWIESNPKLVRTFQLEQEPEIFYLIDTGFQTGKRYLVVHEDAFELSIGDTEFLTKEEVEEKYKIEV